MKKMIIEFDTQQQLVNASSFLQLGVSIEEVEKITGVKVTINEEPVKEILKEKEVSKPSTFKEKLDYVLTEFRDDVNYIVEQHSNSKRYMAICYRNLLFEVAVHLDELYSSHVSESKELWAIDYSKGQPINVEELEKSNYTYKVLPLFRCKDDARIAIISLRPLKNLMLGKQED